LSRIAQLEATLLKATHFASDDKETPITTTPPDDTTIAAESPTNVEVEHGLVHAMGVAVTQAESTDSTEKETHGAELLMSAEEQQLQWALNASLPEDSEKVLTVTTTANPAALLEPQEKDVSAMEQQAEVDTLAARLLGETVEPEVKPLAEDTTTAMGEVVAHIMTEPATGPAETMSPEREVATSMEAEQTNAPAETGSLAARITENAEAKAAQEKQATAG